MQWTRDGAQRRGYSRDREPLIGVVAQREAQSQSREDTSDVGASSAVSVSTRIAVVSNRGIALIA